MVGEERHLRLCLAHTDTGSETGKHPTAGVLTIAQPVFVGVNQRCKAERNPEIGRRYPGANEVVRSDTDDGEGDGIEPDDLAEYGGISSEATLPVVFADQHRGRCGERCHVSSVEGATAYGGNAQSGKVVFGDHEGGGELDIADL